MIVNIRKSKKKGGQQEQQGEGDEAEKPDRATQENKGGTWTKDTTAKLEYNSSMVGLKPTNPNICFFFVWKSHQKG